MAELERKRGDTYADEFTIESKITKAVIDISSGYAFTLTLDPDKKPADNSNNVYQLTGDIVDGPNGIVGFSPTAEQADQLGKFYFDVEMTDPAGKIRTIELDKYTYVQDITK